LTKLTAVPSGSWNTAPFAGAVHMSNSVHDDCWGRQLTDKPHRLQLVPFLSHWGYLSYAPSSCHQKVKVRSGNPGIWGIARDLYRLVGHMEYLLDLCPGKKYLIVA
jgi:hypothetical protein